MKKIKVHINNKNSQDYPIFIGIGLLEQINQLLDISTYSKTLIVTDKNIPSSLVKKLQAAISIPNSIVVLESGERNKNLDNVKKIIGALSDFGGDRKSLVINLGGGVIGDIGGFAASIYMRGIDFIQIPTTLLSSVDASVGGKVGVNFSGIKNLIGTFQQPIAVIIDVDILSTLSEREFVSGFAEIIKHGLIVDKKYFQTVTAKKPQDFSQKELIDIIEKSCQIKIDTVSDDEKENSVRKLLNFGHTVGHAIEAISLESKKPLLHGEAISIGMIAEAKISKNLGLLADEEYSLVEQSLTKAGLPTTFDLPIDKILEKIKSDKKNVSGVSHFTLLERIGKAVINKIVDEPTIRKVL